MFDTNVYLAWMLLYLHSIVNFNAVAIDPAAGRPLPTLWIRQKYLEIFQKKGAGKKNESKQDKLDSNAVLLLLEPIFSRLYTPNNN